MLEKASLKNLRAYVPGKPIADVQKEYGLEKVVKLASNENPFGSSKKVQEVLAKELTSLEYYPDGASKDLKNRLAEFHGLAEDRFLIGAGLDEVIAMVSRALLIPGDEIIVPDPTFPQYEHHAIIEGAKIVKVPVSEPSGEMDLTKMLSSITDQTKVIWLCNPNNPTGTYIKQERIEAFIKEVPNHVLVISDEAYQEYVTVEEESTSIHLLEKFPNLMIMRTFSKAYGLAGLRVGYAITPKKLSHSLDVVRLPFNVGTLAQKAGIVALDDQEFISEIVEKNQTELLKWEEFLKAQEIPYYVSQANFIFFNIETDDQKIGQYLMENGYIVRSGLRPNWLRVTIGHTEDNEAIRAKLLEGLKA